MAEPDFPTLHPGPQQLASYPPPGAPHAVPPGQNLAGERPGGVWRRENILIMALGSPLPTHCVKCNAPAVLPIKERTLYWHHPALYLVVLIQVLLYAIIAMIVRKKAVLSPGLCEVHLRHRRRWILAGWLSPVVIIGLAVLLASLSRDAGVAIVVAVVLTLIAIVVAMRKAQLLVAVRIDDRYAHLKGCGEPFLAGFPPVQDPAP